MTTEKIITKSDVKILELTPEELQKCITFNGNQNTAYHFMIITEEDGKREFHERLQEPCYGGLRKYKATHGEEATDDHSKPGDLRHPFPKGEPVGLCVTFNSYDNKLSEEFERLVRFAFSDQSPMIKGFLSSKNIEFTRHSKTNCISGVIVKSTDGDLTTLVNLLRIIHRKLPRSYQHVETTKKLFDKGLTEYELFSQLMYFYLGVGPHVSEDQYVLRSSKFSLEKHINGDVNIFTKGSFRQRFDYSRKFVQDLMLAEKGENLGIKFRDTYNRLLKESNSKDSEEIYVRTVKEMFNVAA